MIMISGNPRPARRGRAALATLAALVLIVLGMGLGTFATPAFAESQTLTVFISDSGYEPVRITVRPGDKVQWVNVGEQPHSATAANRSFDSNPNCGPGLALAFCMQPGSSPYTHTFGAAIGTFEYGDRATEFALLGSVTVREPAPEPEPEPEPTETASPSPSPSPTPSPTQTASPSPTPTQSVSPVPSASPSSGPTETFTPGPPVTANAPTFGSTSAPVDAGPDPIIAEDLELEEFPEAPEPTASPSPSASASEPDAVAVSVINPPAGRDRLLAAAMALLAMSALVVGRYVGWSDDLA